MITLIYIKFLYILAVYGIDAPLEDFFTNPVIVELLYQIVHIIKNLY